jgi:hypothetical protein
MYTAVAAAAAATTGSCTSVTCLCRQAADLGPAEGDLDDGSAARGAGRLDTEVKHVLAAASTAQRKIALAE